MTMLSGRTALVTGASAGIGEATVRALTAAGAEVHAVARRADRLEALAAETKCTPHVCDVTDAADRAKLVSNVSPDILVNNAGIGAGIAGLVDAEPEEIARTITTNVTAVLMLLHDFLPGMIARGSGHVVTVGSVAGVYPTVSAIYGASKGAMRMMDQNLRIELRGTGVRVTEIQPGRVATEFYDAAIPDAERRDKLKITGITELNAADIAGAILYAVTAPKHVNISTIEIQPTEQSFGGVSFDSIPD
ncbi:SDR family oxidoreductase [Rhodobacteraceae bacterium NNCM2]|nr:SDR family oxidoreductase [Coraliihabitans acroporae]